MKFTKKNIKQTNDDNLLPLVNIIFLLLIFFMIAGVIQKQKYNIRNYTGKNIKLDLFWQSMKYLSEIGHAISMNELLYFIKNKEKPPPNSFTITFDDGFENNISLAAPVLNDLKIPSIIYITTQFINENKIFNAI